MKKQFLFLFPVLLLTVPSWGQLREASPLVYEKSYSYTHFHKSLRDVVNQSDKAMYFDDSFFNSMLKKILEDRRFTAQEKAGLFYLMLQKVGYGFAGVEYIPPRQNYFQQHIGKIFLLENCSQSLQGLNFGAAGLLKVTKEHLSDDPVLSATALLLATLVARDSVLGALEKYSLPQVISGSSQPAILNHYVCLATSLVQNDSVVFHLRKNLNYFRQEEMIEDVLCALYSKNNPVGTIQKYILSENEEKNDLAIQTAINAFASKVPKASYERGLKGLIMATKQKWKQDLLKKILAGKVPFGYSLSSPEILVTKTWQGVTLSQYTNGSLISIGDMMEFDPN